MYQEENTGLSLESQNFEGQKLSDLIPGFLRYGEFELSFSKETIKKYKDGLNQILRCFGDAEVTSLNQILITNLKQEVYSRGAGDARVASIIFALKSFLKYCSEQLELPVIDYKKIKTPRRRRREVIYLTNDEVRQFVESIPIYRGWNGKMPGKYVRMDGLRFRVLVEVLLGTGMRISEALALNKDSINLENGEAKIIGKGNKERTVFFTLRSLEWIKFYLSKRCDNDCALFFGRKSRLKVYDISKMFQTYRHRAGINKKLTPHILRHTVATNLLFNGCPISHVKEILGHENLETTCKYYLGLDKGQAKKAFLGFLKYY